MEKVFKQAIEHFGQDQQVIVAIEELSELQKELTKQLRGFSIKENLIEEIADVYIMLDQVKAIFKIADVQISIVRKQKADRLAKKLRVEE